MGINMLAKSSPDDNASTFSEMISLTDIRLDAKTATTKLMLNNIIIKHFFFITLNSFN
jgi:hypothetical protein